MKNDDIIIHDTSHDGIDRRGFLKCMGWAGTAVVCSISGGILTSRALGDALANPGALAKAGTSGRVAAATAVPRNSRRESWGIERASWAKEIAQL